MAEDRRRVRDVSESSETGQSLNDSVNLNVTECESEGGTQLSQSEGGTQLSQSAATISESEDQHDEDKEAAGEDEEFHDADDAAGSGSETGTQTGEEETGSETDEGTDVTEEEEGEIRDSSEAEDDKEKGDEDSGWIEERRHSGDGEEHVDNAASEKKLDIDEDKSNPAYIPRQGLFFEHDLRLGDDDDKSAADKEEAAKKRLWTTDNRKWTHDRYDERMQAPKSTEELIEIYGYNIRRESGPNGDGPVERPRRGRGKRGARGSQRLGDFIITTGDGDRNDQTAVAETRNDTRDDRDASNRHRHDDENHIDNERPPQRDNNYSSDRPPRGRGGRGRYSDMRQRPDYDNRTDNGERERTGFRGRGSTRPRGFGRGDGFSGDRRNDDGDVAEATLPPREFRAQNSQRTESDDYSRRPADDDRVVENRRSGAENAHQDFRRNAAERGSGYRGGFDGRGFNRGRNFRGTESREYRPAAPRPESRPGGGSEDWDDEVCRVTEGMGTKAAVAETRPGHVEGSEVVPRPARENIGFDNKGVGRGGNQPKLQREPHDAQLRQGFQTRTISNRHYGDAESRLPPPPGLDRKSQIGDIVDVMKKIAVTGSSSRSDVSSSAGRQQSSGTVPPSKMAVITTAPYSSEIVPPVTRTQTRMAAAPSQQALPRRDAPAVMPAAYGNKLDELQAHRVPSPAAAGVAGQPAKPKRYSTQRQRLPADADPASGERISETPTPGGPSVTPSNMSAVIQQPLYYTGDVERAAVPYSGQAPPQSHMVPVGSIAYRLPAGMPPESYYHSSQPVSQSGNSPPSLMHASRYLGPSQLMAPAQPGGQPYYISNPPPTMYSYPPHLIAAAARPYGIAPMHHQYLQPSAQSPQQQPMMSEVSPSMEVRSGTVYFNAETQQPEVRVGGIYYGPPTVVQPAPPSTAVPVRRPNSAIPIINPQADEASVDVQQYYTDVAMAPPPGYVYANYPPATGGETTAMQYTSYGPVDNIPEAEAETGYA